MASELRRVKQEKLASQQRLASSSQAASASRQRNAAADDEDGSEEEEEVAPSRRSNKKARVSDTGDAVQGRASGEDEDDDEHGEDAPAPPRPITLPRDKSDGYVPGSIVRVLLKNFVTYDYVEFSPGPYLNMIIGPNGTGKSSIACALCIGLGWPPAILGRASELKAFVKNGCEEGFIEIELKGVVGKPNLVIRRHLNATDNKSIWKLNGQETTQKEVQARVHGLNVQVDNLCTFLPQDKVSSFAQMTPQQLLKETQKAAGNPNLTRWHHMLIDGGVNLRELDEALKVDHATIEDKQNRNARLEREVSKYKERRAIEKNIEVLNILLPASQLIEAKAMVRDAKRLREKMKAKLNKLNKRNEPLTNLKKTLEVVKDSSTQEREKGRAAMTDKFKAMGRKWTEAEKLETEAQDTQGALDNLKKTEKQRKQRIEAFRTQIRETQHKINNPEPVEDEETIKADLQRVLREGSEAQVAQQNAEDDMRRINDEIDKMARQRDQRNGDLQQLDNVDHQRLMNLKRMDADTADGIVWLRKNRDKFKMEVFEPACISARVTDMRYVDQVEACINFNQFKTFVTQCDEDYKTINHFLNDTNEGVGRKMRVNVWFRPRAELGPPPMTPQELSQLGFNGYAIDYLACPEGMRYYFQRELNMHRTAIGPDNVDTGRAMEMVMRQQGGREANSCTFITGKTNNQVSRSLYGQRKVQNMTRDVKPARQFRQQTADEGRKRALQQDIAQFTEQIEELQKSIEEMKPKLVAAQQLASEKMKEKSAIQKRGANRLAMLKKQNALTLQLETLESKLLAEESHRPSSEQAAKLKKRLIDIAITRVKIAQDYTNLVHEFLAEQEKGTRLILQVAQAEANLTALTAHVNASSAKHAKTMQDGKAANDRYKEALEKAQAAKDQLGKVQAAASEEVSKLFKELEEAGVPQERSSDDVMNEIENEKAKLELNIATNPQVIRQYEEREREIKELQDRVAEKEAKRRRLEKSVQKVKTQWLPALQQLIASINDKFSAAFERVHCAGEVHINQDDEDYDKWAIDIMVKFRDSERLQLLTGHRQSGGERSLTTILYLMSLTELARAPFSLVDEINQGMDQRAERLVHNQLVDVTCREESGQYFLITPKLLPDLQYHERMKVLCINNGEWLPRERGLGNLGKMLDHYVEVQKKKRRSN